MAKRRSSAASYSHGRESFSAQKRWRNKTFEQFKTRKGNNHATYNFEQPLVTSR